MGTVLAQACIRQGNQRQRHRSRPPGGSTSTRPTRAFRVKARTLGDELAQISEKLADDGLQVESLHHRWGILYFTGQTADMLKWRAKALPATIPNATTVFAGVRRSRPACAYCIEAMRCPADKPKNVAASVDAAVLADSLQHPLSLAFAWATEALHRNCR